MKSRLLRFFGYNYGINYFVGSVILWIGVGYSFFIFYMLGKGFFNIDSELFKFKIMIYLLSIYFLRFLTKKPKSVYILVGVFVCIVIQITNMSTLRIIQIVDVDWGLIEKNKSTIQIQFVKKEVKMIENPNYDSSSNRGRATSHRYIMEESPTGVYVDNNHQSRNFVALCSFGDVVKKRCWFDDYVNGKFYQIIYLEYNYKLNGKESVGQEKNSILNVYKYNIILEVRNNKGDVVFNFIPLYKKQVQNYKNSLYFFHAFYVLLVFIMYFLTFILVKDINMQNIL